jgi:hypothetical protein
MGVCLLIRYPGILVPLSNKLKATPMFFYILCFEDGKHLKVGIGETFKRVEDLWTIYPIEKSKTFLVESKDKRLIGKMEHFIKISTEKYWSDQVELLKPSQKANAGLTEIRLLESIPTIESHLIYFQTHFGEELSYKRVAEVYCSCCNTTKHEIKKSSLNQLPWKVGSLKEQLGSDRGVLYKAIMKKIHENIQQKKKKKFEELWLPDRLRNKD